MDARGGPAAELRMADGGGGSGLSCCPRIIPPAKQLWMLTPLIVVNVTSVWAKSPPPSSVRPMEVAGGGWSYECMRVVALLPNS